MPDTTMNCSHARLQAAAYLSGEPCPSLVAHLATCDDCTQFCIESALKEAPAVVIAPRFAARVAAQLPPCEPERSWAPAAAAILFALLGLILWLRGDSAAVAQTLLQWQTLAVVALVETGLVLAWVWRVTVRQE